MCQSPQVCALGKPFLGKSQPRVEELKCLLASNCQPPTCGTTSTQTTVTSLGAQLGTTPTSALSQQPVVSLPQRPNVENTATPPLISNAAASFEASLRNGHLQSNFGYNGLSMQDLRSNPEILRQANLALGGATGGIPALNPNPLAADVGRGRGHQVLDTVDQLYRATTVNKQLRAAEQTLLQQGNLVFVLNVKYLM